MERNRLIIAAAVLGLTLGASGCDRETADDTTGTTDSTATDTTGTGTTGTDT